VWCLFAYLEHKICVIGGFSVKKHCACVCVYVSRWQANRASHGITVTHAPTCLPKIHSQGRRDYPAHRRSLSRIANLINTLNWLLSPDHNPRWFFFLYLLFFLFS
jgi:hypothetical protein